MAVERAIWFDMDGTIADLYAVEDWLSKLRAEDPSPYIEARPMLNMQVLARMLNRLSEAGFKLGVISWASKGASQEYMGEILRAKVNWLNKHLPSVPWDFIAITPYGVNKSKATNYMGGILFDDDERNRKLWCGKAYPETEIMNVLREL